MRLKLAVGPNSRFPDFYIIGAPKCGTTALFRYLSGHPDIFVPEHRKEPSFFCSDIQIADAIRDSEAYAALFAGAKPHLKRLEASVWYLYSQIAVERIIASRPDAKFVVILRNPIRASQSLHAQFLRGAAEEMSSFEDAWRAQDRRSQGMDLPASGIDPTLLQYGSVYSYGPQVARLFSHVPAERRHIILFEEFFSEPQLHYAKLLNFLGLRVEIPRTFPKVNMASGVRSVAVARFLRRHSIPGNGKTSEFLQSSGIIKAVSVLNKIAVKMESLSPEFEAEVQRHFSASNVLLERLLDRRLDSWRI